MPSMEETDWVYLFLSEGLSSLEELYISSKQKLIGCTFFCLRLFPHLRSCKCLLRHKLIILSKKTGSATTDVNESVILVNETIILHNKNDT